MLKIEESYGEATVKLTFRNSYRLGMLAAHPTCDHVQVQRPTSCLQSNYGVLFREGVIYTPTSLVARFLDLTVTAAPTTHVLGRKAYTVVNEELAERIIQYNTGWEYSNIRSRARAEVIVAFVFAVTN